MCIGSWNSAGWFSGISVLADCRYTDQKYNTNFIGKSLVGYQKVSEGTQGICGNPADGDEKDVGYGK